MNSQQILARAWPEWSLGPVLGRGGYGVVYKISRKTPEESETSALKIIAVPQDDYAWDSLKLEGFSDEESRDYYRNLTERFAEEVRLMQSLQDTRHVVRIRDSAILPKEDGKGYYLLIRMELLKPLTACLSEKKLSETEVLRLGRDICQALEVCREKNILHRDIKPENIFIDENGDYKLGDFGVARQLEELSTTLSRRGTTWYMAPEAAAGAPYDHRADLYALGLLLYRLLNGNRLPFLPDKQLFSSKDREEALKRRLTGEEFPPAAEASEAVNSVLRKACAFRKEDRYTSAAEFEEALAAAERQNAAGTAWTAGLRRSLLLAALLILLAAAGVFLIKGRQRRPEETSSVPDTVPVTETASAAEAASETVPSFSIAETRTAESPTNSTAETSAAETSAAETAESSSAPEVNAECSHIFGDCVILKKAACETEGCYEQTCLLCGYVQTKTIPAEMHFWTWAHCGKPETCYKCGATRGEPGEHVPSDYNNGHVCQLCGVLLSSTVDPHECIPDVWGRCRLCHKDLHDFRIEAWPRIRILTGRPADYFRALGYEYWNQETDSVLVVSAWLPEDGTKPELEEVISEEHKTENGVSYVRYTFMARRFTYIDIKPFAETGWMDYGTYRAVSEAWNDDPQSLISRQQPYYIDPFSYAEPDGLLEQKLFMRMPDGSIEFYFGSYQLE